MLPCAPHHHLLLDEPGLATLVMTSGNISGHPIAYTNDDALAQLFEIADQILLHDRDIEIRVDDSIVRWTTHPELPEPMTTFIRRARGYAPYPVAVTHDLAPVVAYGAELKTTVALSDGARVYLSQHIGDLKNDATWTAHRRTADHIAALHELTPAHSAADLHPQFRAVGDIRVQHHHAHMSACMAENKLSGTVLGVIFDGAGYGTDGTIWGGEFLLGDYREARRVARLRHLPLLGGDQAVRHPIRTGFALALDAGVHFPVLETLSSDQRHVFAAMARRGINSPPTSSMGRLFDGVAALLGVCTHAEYEAQGPIELEGLLERDPAMAPPYVFADAGDTVDPRPVIAALAADVAAGVPIATMSRRFHSGVVDMVVRRCLDIAEASDVDAVVLSGGVFLNEFLLVNCLVQLRAAGLPVYCHRLVPANDGGIALGQVMVADATVRAGAR
jgi:hydrogenase maturation protein HypF